MKRLLAALIFILLAAPAYAQDSMKGFIAAERGDFETALREWRPLAEQGDVIAQYNLGILFARGDGVPQDYVEATEWFRLAAEQGHKEAQYELGIYYELGQVGPQDYPEAARWYRLAAEQGHSVGNVRNRKSTPLRRGRRCTTRRDF